MEQKQTLSLAINRSVKNGEFKDSEKEVKLKIKFQVAEYFYIL